MNDIEINTAARGIMGYLAQCGDPNDALAILICVLLIYYERAVFKENMPLDKFADGLKTDLLALWQTRNIPTRGTDTLQ